MSSEQLILIDTNEDLETLKEYIKDKNIIALDTETNGTSYKESEVIGFSICAEPNIAFYVVLSKWVPKEITVQETRMVKRGKVKVEETIDVKKLSGDLASVISHLAASEFLALLKGKSLILHNAIFDCAMIESNFGVSLIQDVHTDTMVLGHLLDENRSNGLKELGVSIFGQDSRKEQEIMKASVLKNGGMLTKDHYELYKADWNLLGHYGAKDTILTYNLFYHFLPLLEEEGLWDFFYNDESMPLLRESMYQLNTIGLRIDADKLETLKKSLEAEILELLAYIDKETKPLVKEKYPCTSKTNTFNIGSSKQLAWLLFDRLGNRFNNLTESGRELCQSLNMKLPYTDVAKLAFITHCKENKGVIWADAGWDAKKRKKTGAKKIGDWWNYVACGKETLKKLSGKYKWVEKYLEYAKAKKLLNTYVLGIQERMRYNIIQPSFLQIGTTSGRLACIAEGQMISMPGGDKRIEDVKVGDLVYCFTSTGKPTISKVKNVFDNGNQECIELTWRSQGSHKLGTLTCTPDHKIKTRENGWVQAQDLKKDERVYHLRRALNLVSERARIYGPGYFMKLEEQMIKTEVLGGKDSDHVHHINENKSDNRVSNLQLLSSAEHARLHGIEMALAGKIKYKHLHLPQNRPMPTYGVDNPIWKKLTKFQALRMLAKARGRAVKVDMDFDTFKNKCRLLNIDLYKVKQRYNDKGQYLSRGFVINAIKSSKRQKDAIASTGVHLYRFKEICREMGLELNHKIVSTKAVGIRKVYDLEVEKHHNFIANEICVHNCRAPNFQNLPRKDKRIKACIVSRPGKSFVGADYSQLEPRVFASFAKDERLLRCFTDGLDFYSVIGKDVFGVNDCTLIKSDEDKNFFGNKYPHYRDQSKGVALSATYGTTPGKLSQLLNIEMQEAKMIIDRYFEAYPQVELLMLESHEMAKKDGKVSNLFGRPRRMPAAKNIKSIYGNTQHSDLPYEIRNLLNLSVNHRIQATGASIVNRACIQFIKNIQLAEVQECRILMQVHDEVIVECKDEDIEVVTAILKHAMEETTTLPGVQLIAEPKHAKNLADLK